MSLLSRPSEIIPRIAANDPSLTEVTLNDNATYQMKSADYTKQIADALSNNDTIKRLTLSKLNLTDQSVSLIAEVLKTNKSLEKLDVSNNKFGNVGLIAIAEALKSNSTLIELSVIGQSQPFGEAALQKMTEMFEYNIQLQKINWRLHSRQSFALNKLISRNVDINRRIAAGQKLEDYINTVPGPRKPDFGVSEDFIAVEGGAPPTPTTAPTPTTTHATTTHATTTAHATTAHVEPAVETPHAIETHAIETHAKETHAIETHAIETPAIETLAIQIPAEETHATKTTYTEDTHVDEHVITDG